MRPPAHRTTSTRHRPWRPRCRCDRPIGDERRNRRPRAGRVGVVEPCAGPASFHRGVGLAMVRVAQGWPWTARHARRHGAQARPPRLRPRTAAPCSRAAGAAIDHRPSDTRTCTPNVAFALQCDRTNGDERRNRLPRRGASGVQPCAGPASPPRRRACRSSAWRGWPWTARYVLLRRAGSTTPLARAPRARRAAAVASADTVGVNWRAFGHRPPPP